MMPWRLRAYIGPFRPELERAAETARCAAAEALFEDTRVKAAVLAAADLGRKVCAFHPIKPIDLRGTPAADAIEKWAKKEGLQVRWTDPVPVLEHGVEVGQTRSMVISWETPQLPLA